MLYAQATALNARVALVAAQHDRYVAEATLLRHVGQLEARILRSNTKLDDGVTQIAQADRRTPVYGWNTTVRGADRMALARTPQSGVAQMAGGRPNWVAPASVMMPGTGPRTISELSLRER